MNSVIGALRVDLGLNSAQFQSGLKQSQTSMQKFGAAVKVGAMAAVAAVGAVGVAMVASVRQQMNAADDMAKTAQKIGVPIDELSRLKHAAELSGVSFGVLQGGVRKLSTAMADLTDKGSPALKALEGIGISSRDSEGNMRATSEVLAEMADRFKEMPDGAEKTAIAVAVLGRAGADMIPMLNGGSEALRKMMDEADALGLVFTPEMAAASERFNDNMTRLGSVFGGMGNVLATELAPQLADFTDWLVTAAPKIISFTAGVVNFVAGVVRAASAFRQSNLEMWASFRETWDGMTAKVAEVKAAFVQFAADIVAVFQAIPGQMAQIGVDIMQGLVNGITSMGSAVMDSLMSPITGGVNKAKSWLGIHSPSTLMHEMGVNVMQGLSNGMESMADSVESLAESIAGTLTSAFMSIIDGSKKVGDVLKDLLKQVTSMMLNNAMKSLLGGLFGGMGGGGGILGALFGGFRAAGGPVSGGRAYVVGERGPELMVPSSSGTVIPNHQLGERTMRVEIVGSLVDDNGVIKARVDTMGRQAAQAGAAMGARQVSEGFPGMMSDAQMRSM